MVPILLPARKMEGRVIACRVTLAEFDRSERDDQSARAADPRAASRTPDRGGARPASDARARWRSRRTRCLFRRRCVRPRECGLRSRPRTSFVSANATISTAMPRSFARSRSRGKAARPASGVELEQMLRHQQHADDVQLLGTRPVEIGDGLLLASRGNHFGETKRGDAAPAERPAGGVGEAGSRDAQRKCRRERRGWLGSGCLQGAVCAAAQAQLARAALPTSARRRRQRDDGKDGEKSHSARVEGM